MKVRWSLVAIGLWAGLVSLPRAADEKKPDDPPKKKAGKTYQVPYLLTDTQHVMVRAKINGKGPFNFIVDTGAPALFVATAVAKKIGIEGDKKNWTTLDRFELEGGVVQEKVKCRVETPFQIEGMNALGLPGVELHGIMGYTALARYKMEFDFTRDKMTWLELDFDPPQPKAVMVKGKEGDAMAGLEMLGGMMKFLGALAGIRPAPPPVPRGFVGIELAEAGGMVTVKGVLKDGPAAKAGLKAGDRIEQVKDNDVASFADVVRHLANVTVGQSVRFRIVRGDEKLEINVKAGEGL